jgi:hypothetical protein
MRATCVAATEAAVEIIESESRLEAQPSRASARSRDPASLRPQPKRSGYDFWATPPCLTEALTEAVLPSLRKRPIWEFAAGDGRLAKGLRGAGYTVIASDIEPRGEGIKSSDFLTDEPPQAGLVAATNPPFNQLNHFLARGLHLLDSRRIAGLVLLVRCDALTTATRADAFNRATGILTCCWRPVWIEGSKGNGRWSNAWVWWLPDHPGPTATRWLLKPGRKQRKTTLPIIKSARGSP